MEMIPLLFFDLFSENYSVSEFNKHSLVVILITFLLEKDKPEVCVSLISFASKIFKS